MYPRRVILAIAAAVALVIGMTAAPTPVGALVDRAAIVPTPDPNPLSVLRSVSCVSESWCIAVGDSAPGAEDDESARIMGWDGTSWSVVPVTPPGDRSLLLGTSCLSESMCAAVGFYRSPEGNKPLVLMWDGVSWNVPVVPIPPGNGGLDAVSCVSATRCTAVGSTDAGTLVMTFDGTSWTIVPSPSPGDFESLNSVACVSESWCTAVGYAAVGATLETLVLTFDGSAWSQVSSPSVGVRDLLKSVSCVSTTSCVAVGSTEDNLGEVTMLAMVFDGTAWTLAPTPDAGGKGELMSVSCVSTRSCVAVGGSVVGEAVETSVFTWDGTAWSRVPSPNRTEDPYNALSGVSCANEDWCMAVGESSLSTETEDRYSSLAMVLSVTPPTPPSPEPPSPVTPSFTG